MSNKEFVGRVSDKSFVFNGDTVNYQQISFTMDDLNKMAQFFNAQGFVNLKLMVSQKSGKKYLEIDTWKPNMNHSNDQWGGDNIPPKNEVPQQDNKEIPF